MNTFIHVTLPRSCLSACANYMSLNKGYSYESTILRSAEFVCTEQNIVSLLAQAPKLFQLDLTDVVNNLHRHIHFCTDH